MPKVKGYYNVDNEVFLGTMMATNEGTGVASTPRYIEGVCFGEYDTDTEEFVPETNPMRIPKGVIMTRDEDAEAFTQGKFVEHVTGIEEDKGADIARKNISLVNPVAKPNLRKIKTVSPLSVDIGKLF